MVNEIVGLLDRLNHREVLPHQRAVARHQGVHQVLEVVVLLVILKAREALVHRIVILTAVREATAVPVIQEVRVGAPAARVLVDLQVEVRVAHVHRGRQDN